MLEIKGLSAGYGGERILKNLSFTADKGSITSVIGANGCGKSTLLRAILGFLQDVEGEVRLDDIPLYALSRGEIARRVAYLSQGRDVPEMRVLEMVLHGRFPHLGYPRRYGARDREIAKEALEKTGIAHLADAPIATLSGGMRQNAYIAMALAQNTEYILLDEPTTYLDTRHALSLMGTLRMLASEGKGIVTVMHDLPLAFAFSDKIVVINGGNIAAEDKPAMLAEARAIEDVFGVALGRAEDGAYYYKYKNG